MRHSKRTSTAFLSSNPTCPTISQKTPILTLTTPLVSTCSSIPILLSTHTSINSHTFHSKPPHRIRRLILDRINKHDDDDDHHHDHTTIMTHITIISSILQATNNVWFHLLIFFSCTSVSHSCFLGSRVAVDKCLFAPDI